MSDSTPTSLDFHRPRQPSNVAWRQLASWLQGICAQTQEGWASLLAQPVTMHPGKIEPAQFHSALARLPEDGYGLYFSIGPSLLPSMFVLSSRQMLGLVADLLDLPGETWPEPHPLSIAEESMLELLFQKLARALGDAWPDDQPLKSNYLEYTNKPRRTRLFPLGAALFDVKFTIKSRFGEETGHWLLLKEETERLVHEYFGDQEPEERAPHPSLLALTEKIPAQVVVHLGQAEVSMAQMAHLAVGDVLVLDQFVSRPLLATLEGVPKWAGMPLRIGSRQALEVTRVLEGESASSLLTPPPGGKK